MSNTHSTFPVERFLAEDAYGVFIDDTGSPGMENTPPPLHPDRKSWVAIIIPPDQKRAVTQALQDAVDALRADLGKDEYHFVEIYNGKCPFRQLSIEERLIIFQYFADIVYVHGLPILVQTLDPDSHAQSMFGKLKLPKIASCFDMSSPQDTALWLLLTRVWDYIRSTRTNENHRAFVCIDEGFKRPGFSPEIDVMDDALHDGRIYFASSAELPLIQLADFAAFCLNRTQLAIRRDKRNTFDMQLLQVLSPIASQYINMTKKLLWPAAEGPLVD